MQFWGAIQHTFVFFSFFSRVRKENKENKGGYAKIASIYGVTKMNDCAHEWLIMGIADVDDDVMELDGWLDLACDHCPATARFPRPSYKLLWQITRAWMEGRAAYWHDDIALLIDVQEPISYQPASEESPVGLSLFEGMGGADWETSLDGGPDVDGGMVAELINGLELWGDDSEDIPF